jgi:hypothetical protein
VRFFLENESIKPNHNLIVKEFNLKQIIDISNCYSTGIITSGFTSGAILGGRTNNIDASASVADCSFNLSIKNCFTLETTGGF